MLFGLAARVAVGAVAPILWCGYSKVFQGKTRKFKKTTAAMNVAPLKPGVKVSVVVPAYNEELNIVECVRSVLDGCDLERDMLEVVVVDDLSTDKTWQLITDFQRTHPKGDRLTVMSAGPRPKDEVWLGKCWAVLQGSKHCTGEYIVFIDADVRVKPRGLEKAVAAAIAHNADLLSGDLQYTCRCNAERLIQPVVLQNLVINNDHDLVNDISQPVASAAGHMMVFNKELYDAIGGHKVVRDHVVEDVMIAYFVKTVAKRKVHYFDFTDVASLSMYPKFSDLLEGYSKNIFLAFDRSLTTVLAVSTLNLVAFAAPPLTLIAGLWTLGGTPGATLAGAALVTEAVVSFIYQYRIRAELERQGRIDSDWWYLQTLGGLMLVAISWLSAFKGLTGWRWTWKGRQLQMPSEA